MPVEVSETATAGSQADRTDSPTAAADAGVLAVFAAGLPVLRTNLSREQVLQKLDMAARSIVGPAPGAGIPPAN